MQKSSSRKELAILISCFIVSRIIAKLLGVSFGYQALFEYWQYLDVTTLEHNLLAGVWHQHSQPPVFNLLLGVVLKLFGPHSLRALEYFFLLVSLFNGCMIFFLLKRLSRHPFVPLGISLLYVLSPATILFENELFYTEFISMMLLLVIYFVIRFKHRQSWLNALSLFITLTILCLTRSMYHLVWLIAITAMLLYYWFGKYGFRKLLAGALLSTCLVSGWYIKNYIVFGIFSTSSWTGINFSRIVFHDIETRDSSSIASVHPFLPVSYYKKYISGLNEKKYAGIDDKNLLDEAKNDSFVNMNHVDYLEISKKYMDASKSYVKEHPVSYLKNVFKSFIIFFSPASSYFQVQDNNNRIRYYDLVYSFNLSHLFKEKEKKRVALAISAIPKFLLYFITFYLFLRDAIRRRSISTVNLVIVITILFILGISTILEYGENMRFRYEAEPLFLILLGQVWGELVD